MGLVRPVTSRRSSVESRVIVTSGTRLGCPSSHPASALGDDQVIHIRFPSSPGPRTLQRIASV